MPSGDPLEGADLRLREEVRHSEIAFRGVFFEVQRDQVLCPDGHEGVREFIDHPGAVMVVAVAADGQIILERQYRHPLGRCFIELPAGKLERGEDPLVCAQRELEEETGYRAAQWLRLGAFHNAIGYSNEQIAVYLARDLSRSAQATDAGEVIEVFSAPLAQLIAWIDSGIVTDVKTIVGAYWAQRHCAGIC